eukprot:g4721.t1 g4721   contig16:154086-155139(+)
MKSIIALSTIALASAGTNKTLAPTPFPGRPTPIPTPVNTYIVTEQTPAPTPGDVITPAPTICEEKIFFFDGGMCTNMFEVADGSSYNTLIQCCNANFGSFAMCVYEDMCVDVKPTRRPTTRPPTDMSYNYGIVDCFGKSGKSGSGCGKSGKGSKSSKSGGGYGYGDNYADDYTPSTNDYTPSTNDYTPSTDDYEYGYGHGSSGKSGKGSKSSKGGKSSKSSGKSSKSSGKSGKGSSSSGKSGKGSDGHYTGDGYRYDDDAYYRKLSEGQAGGLRRTRKMT